MKKDFKQLEKQLNVYYLNHQELKKPNFYCKDCGKLLIYDNAKIGFQTRNGKYKDTKKGDIISEGLTFLSTRDYNSNIYYLCRCKECVAKKYPDIYNKKFLYAAKFAKYTQYAFDVSDNDFEQYTKERQAITKDNMIKKYGEEKGLEKWNSYCQKQSITNTFEYKKEKYGMTEEEFKKYNKSRSSTKELFIKRHGEEVGIKMWNEYCERQRYTTSLEYFIKEYGEELGKEKYEQFDHGRTTFGGASKIADNFFEDLIKNEIFENHEIYFNNHPIEYCINGYRLDFYDKTLNLVIEFYGDLWHRNPKTYNKNDIVTDIFNPKHTYLVKDIWKRDKIRKNNIIKTLNCNFIIIWESEVKKSEKKKQKTIDKIVNIIKNQELKNNGD